MISSPAIDNSYTYSEPKPIVRFVEQNATPTSFDASNYTIPTGSFYEIDYIGEIINSSLQFINDIPVLPIDIEMDDFVEALINSTYADTVIVPLI